MVTTMVLHWTRAWKEGREGGEEEWSTGRMPKNVGSTLVWVPLVRPKALEICRDMAPRCGES
jgi:hypothetical protein